MKLNNSCILCNQKKFYKIKPSFRFVNSDITISKNKIIFLICNFCGTLQKNINHNYIKNLSKFYNNYNIYEKFNTSDQVKFNNNGKSTPRSFVIYNKIFKNLNFKNFFSVLDYGSGNGNMLLPFLDNYYSILYASDIHNNLSKNILLNKKFVKFINLNNLKNISKKFDLILLSHSLEHLIDPVTDMKLLSSKLKKNGKILVQIPNYQENPYDLVIYDHCVHFDNNSLNYLCYKAGLKIKKICKNIINSEFTIILEQNNKKAFFLKKNLSSSIKKIFFYLENVITKLKKYKNFSILGSSVSALWVFFMLKKKVLHIYDEDVNKFGRKFYNKIIKSLVHYENEKIFLPFSSKRVKIIKKRFLRKKYNFATT
jgi:2-polyprenyl-3-methyl-5-hydroxy-6-metoxy-1,4-benzoquinol methylase